MKYKMTPDEKLFLSMNLPTSQTAETLWLLLMKQTITTKLLFLEANILNPTARISNLRKKGLEIKCIDKKFTNKFGREGKYGLYRLIHKDKGIELYKQLLKH